MAFSGLATYIKVSPNKTVPKKYKVDTITIHCFVGQVTAKEGADYFANPKRGASANYVVGKNGDISGCVDELHRAWTTGGNIKNNGLTGAENDHRAVTIEVACDAKEPYTVNQKAFDALINLCADICRRNNIKKLVWSKNKSDRINHKDGCNMTVHRDYDARSCPGKYLYDRMGQIADLVNGKLGASKSFIYNGVDYAPVFDPKYYREHYKDVVACPAFGNTDEGLFKHFCQYGMNEINRRGNEEFNVLVYKTDQKNMDLRAAFGEKIADYYKHYCLFGKDETWRVHK